MIVTNLKVSDPSIGPGHIIYADSWKTKNIALHSLGKICSHALIWSLECPSNNTTAGKLPSDKTKLDAFVGNIEGYVEHIEKRPQAETGAYEQKLEIHIPKPHELMKYTNQRLSHIGGALANLMKVLATVDSQGLPNTIGEKDLEKIKKAIEYLKAEIAFWWAADIPDTIEVGKIVPSLDNDSAQYVEASKEAGEQGLRDEPDIEAPSYSRK